MSDLIERLRAMAPILRGYRRMNFTLEADAMEEAAAALESRVSCSPKVVRDGYAGPAVDRLERRASCSLSEPVAGWRLVPIEPTDEMLSSGLFAGAFKPEEIHAFEDAATVYRAMLSAAPASPLPAADEGAVKAVPDSAVRAYKDAFNSYMTEWTLNNQASAFDPGFEAARKGLSAALPFLSQPLAPGAVEARTLEWTPDRGDFLANTPHSQYRVSSVHDDTGPHWEVRTFRLGQIYWRCETEGEAKNAAQADALSRLPHIDQGEGWQAFRRQPWMTSDHPDRWSSHDEAMETIRGAASVSTLSYEEAAMVYARARGLIVDDARMMADPPSSSSGGQ